MTQKKILLLLLVLAGCGGLYYFNAEHDTPAGQPPLTSLTPENFTTLATAFNAAEGEVRVVLLLSPT